MALPTGRSDCRLRSVPCTEPCSTSVVPVHRPHLSVARLSPVYSPHGEGSNGSRSVSGSVPPSLSSRGRVTRVENECQGRTGAPTSGIVQALTALLTMLATAVDYQGSSPGLATVREEAPDGIEGQRWREE